MHPLVIFKGKRKEKALDRITGVVVQMQENAWMTEEIALRWLTTLWGGIVSTRYRRMDFHAHKTDRVKRCANEVYATPIWLSFLQAACTSLLQAPDISWNKPFKVLAATPEPLLEKLAFDG
jgi:hypothetical protein